MSKVIYKYELYPERSGHTLNEGYQVLDVQMQGDIPVVWILTEISNPIVSTAFNIYGTGWNLPENPGKYIATFQMDNNLVFHVFEELQ